MAQEVDLTLGIIDYLNVEPLYYRLQERLAGRGVEFRRGVPTELNRALAAGEIDLANEGHNAERIAANLAVFPHVLIPKVHWAHTHERINVQEYIAGIPGSDLERVSAEVKHGLLTVTLPKHPEARPKAITVKTS